jgi:hypothetical protein
MGCMSFGRTHYERSCTRAVAKLSTFLLLCGHISQVAVSLHGSAVVTLVDDRLDAARGTLVAVVIGAALWAGIVFVIW